MVSRHATLFGLRLYLSVSIEQVVDHWLLALAAPWESKVLPALLEDAAGVQVLADNAYHDPGIHHELARKRQIRVWAVPRGDYRPAWPAAFRGLVKRVRERIESAFSILARVFHIQQPGARSLQGAVARVSTRILAYTLLFVTAPLLDHFASPTPN